jgi:hypothetical protein
MARTINSKRTTKQDEGTKQRGLTDQHTPFVGLIVSPFAALLITAFAHYLILGWTWGSHEILKGKPGYLGAAIIIGTLFAVAVAFAAWHFSYDRHQTWRIALTLSAAFVGMWIPLLIWTGFNRYLWIFFVLCSWGVAAVWAMPRLHVLRRDPRENDGGGGEDDLMQELGLKGFKFSTPNIEYDDKGEETRRVYHVRHKLGKTRDVLTHALPGIESVFGAPGGLSRAVKPDNGRSNETVLTVLLQDPLVGRVPYDGPSAPGAPVTEPALVGRYDDGLPVFVWTMGGFVPDRPIHRDDAGTIVGQFLVPTGYAFMGMTRAGKTVTENRLLLDGVVTRRGGVILYLNKSKGEQDVAPIIDGVEAAVLSDNVGDYEMALRQVKAIITYRQKQLARYGIQAWSYEKCFANPPKQTVDGRPEPMDPMPALMVHVGEADAILETAGDEAVYIASKGLSTGVLAGWSLQRWSATSMPTDLRFNLGCRFCFGVGDDYSAHFALSDPTVAAGAHPENWRNTKPGRFYVEGAGIDDTRWPVSAKGIGDTNDDALYGNMRRDAAVWGPRMSRLDQGSVVATHGWWGRCAAETLQLRARLTGGGAAQDVPDDAPTAPPAPPQPRPYQPPAEENPMRPQAAAFVVDDVTDLHDADRMAADQEVRTEIATTDEVDGRTIRGDMIRPDPEGSPDGYFDEMSAADPAAEIPAPPPDDIVLDEGKPEAKTRQDAELALDNAIRAALADADLRDPDDETGRSAIVRTGQLQKLYPFRSRQWYSPLLRELADGERMCPPGIRVERMPDRTGQGWYRLINTASEGNTQN